MTGQSIDADQRNERDATLPGAVETIVLTTADTEAFAAMLLDAPEPNEHLRRAVQSHRALIGEAP